MGAVLRARSTLRPSALARTAAGAGVGAAAMCPCPAAVRVLRPSVALAPACLPLPSAQAMHAAGQSLTSGRRTFSLWSSASAAAQDPGTAASEPAPASAQPAAAGHASAPTAPLVEVDPVEGLADASAAPVDLTTEFAAAGLPNGWATVPTMQAALEGVMQSTGLPWWGVIVGAVVALKALTLPVAIKGMRSTVKLQEMTPRMTVLMEELKAAKKKGEPSALAAKQREVSAAMKEANPMAPLMPMFITTPLFVTLFFALDKMAHAGLWSMTHGGALWFPDLTETDPYLALPIISAIGQMTSSELGFANQAQSGPAAKYAGTTKTAMRVGMLASPILTRNFPAAVLLMWATNAFLTAGQSYLLSRPRVKHLLGIAPKQPAEPQQPPPPDVAKALKARIQREQRSAAAAKLMSARGARAPAPAPAPAPTKKSKPHKPGTAAAPASAPPLAQKASARRPPSKIAGRK